MSDQSTGERTEKPTPKRIKDARERGQVARSRDLSAALSFAAVTLGLAWLGFEIVALSAERIAAEIVTLADRAHTPIVPVSAGPVTAVSPPPIEPVDFGTHVPDDVEAEVLRYRRALRAGTICRKCGEANPEGSVYCADCGSKLPLEDAREFD